jgi:SAM-dependent methyltransferase
MPERSVLSSFQYVQRHLLGQPVLDLGCSVGHYLHSLGEQSIGVDIAEEDLRVCCEQGLRVARCDLDRSLSFPDGSFPLVFCAHVLEHVESPIALLRECNRVLEERGKLVLGLPVEATLQDVLGLNQYFDDHDGHLYAFSPRNADVLLRKTGFEARRVYLEPWPSAKLQALRLLAWQLRLIQLLPRVIGMFLCNGYWVVALKQEARISRRLDSGPGVRKSVGLP